MEQTTTWEAALAEAKRLGRNLSQTKWDLGDLALTHVPMEPKGGDHRSDQRGARPFDRLAQMAEAAGVTVDQLDEYRAVAAAFLEEARTPSASWSAHREARNHPDRVAILRELVAQGTTTVADVARAVGHRTPGIRSTSTVEEKAEQVTRFLAEPKVAEAVLRDRDTRHAVAKAQVRVEAEEWNDPKARERREQTRQTIEPVIRKAANMAVGWADIKLADAAEAVHSLIEDDADIEERFLTAWQAHVRAIATDLTVYCARRGIPIDFADVALGGTGGVA